jgi:hypothetical protein
MHSMPIGTTQAKRRTKVGTLNSHILGSNLSGQRPRRIGKVISLQIPFALHKRAKRRAQQDAVTFSAWIRRCMAVELRRKF